MATSHGSLVLQWNGMIVSRGSFAPLHTTHNLIAIDRDCICVKDIAVDLLH